VLLKNNGILPLHQKHESILVCGPTAASTTALLGNYYGFSPRLVTMAEGIMERAPEGCRVVYRTGSPVSSPMAPGVNYTYGTAAENELTIAVIGLDPSLEGEEGDTVASPTGGDRDVIELPKVQLEFITELRKHARKLIVVLTGGSAIAVPEVQEFADAVLQVWYPGCEGGRALADVLFGDASPSGKLPLTVPRRTADLPPFIDYAMKGRTYRFTGIEPLYPFGFGLGYAKFAYGPLTLSAAKLAAGQELVARTTITNSSDRAGQETVQCYLQPPRSWANAPLATLVDFQKISVPARGSVTVEFKLNATAFAQVDAAGQHVHVPGSYGLVLGSASPGPRSLTLGAPAPATGTIALV
jgi:beta-glucosidase